MAFTNNQKPRQNMATLTSFLLLLSWQSPASHAHSPNGFTTSTDTIPTSTYYNTNSPSSSIGVSMNKIDRCWRTNTNWASNRLALADCAIGFGKAALGGKYGEVYTVTDPSADPISPKPGTLRCGAIQTEPLWIVFEKDMHITLENELMVNSLKTIDGRGARVEIGYGPCIMVQGVSHVVIHGLSIHDCRPGKSGPVWSTPTHVGHRIGSDGDAISIISSSNIWVDHCSFSESYDGLVDVTHGSTAVTISNNFFSNHDKVMLFGHEDSYVADKMMKVTVVFNHFGPGCVQRMPRVRIGYAQVANNRYDEREMYAIGGSANPTILSEGNYFTAPDNTGLKERESGGWKNWKWRSSKDVFLNGAYFVQSGWGSCAPKYTSTQFFTAAQGWMVPILTSDAGPVACVAGKPCKS